MRYFYFSVVGISINGKQIFKGLHFEYEGFPTMRLLENKAKQAGVLQAIILSVSELKMEDYEEFLAER